MAAPQGDLLTCHRLCVARLADVTEAGARLELAQPLPSGCLITLRFSVAGTPLVVFAITRWARDGVGNGIELLDLTAEQAALLHAPAREQVGACQVLPRVHFGFQRGRLAVV